MANEIKSVTAHELAGMMFKRHTHAHLCRSEEIVYREQDVIRLLQLLGYPKPDFEGFAHSVKFLGKAFPWDAVK